MKIVLAPEVALKLETIGAQTRGMEFSGYGFVTREKDVIHVYDVVLLDIGSAAFTEIQGKDAIPLLMREDAPNLKLWFHRHPVGNGIPGPGNWSSRDEYTIQMEPLGGVPQNVRWSCSIVRTPYGWVGRVDNHLAKQTIHVEVEPSSKSVFREVSEILGRKRSIFDDEYSIVVDDEDEEGWEDDDDEFPAPETPKGFVKGMWH